jgi:protein SCO1
MTVKRVLLIALMSLALGLTAFAALGLWRGAASPAFEATDITGVDWGKDFQLIDHAGKPRTLADFRGQVVAVFFGYTNCPDVCPTALAQLSEAMKLLGSDASRVQVLFITVDPRRDTPQVLSQYVPAFHPSFLGLHSDAQTIERTTKHFKVFFNAHAANEHGAYMVDHSGSVFVFDPQGRLRLLMKGELPPRSMANDMRRLLGKAS